MIGTHRVTLYRTLSGWGPSLPTNSQLTNDVVGWGPAPFEIAPVWEAGSARLDRGGGFNRVNTDPTPTLRNLADTYYRVRFRIQTPVTATIRWGITIGRTVAAVSSGEFFSSGNGKDYLSPGGVVYPAGIYTFQSDFLVPASQDPTMIYVGPRIVTPYRPDTTAGPTRVDFVDMYALPVVDTADLTCFVDDLAIRHGRADTTSQPDPSSATLNLAWDAAADTLPAVVEIGSAVEVATTIPGYPERLRFRGRITDISLGWDDALEDTPRAELAQISAVSTMADLGRRVVGDQPWPIENDAQRVARVASLAGMPLDPMVSDPGVVQIRARDVDSQEALGVMRGVAESASGIVWMDIGGSLRYTDMNARGGPSGAALDLDACDVLVTPSWTRNLDGLTNEVSIGYGVGSGGQQPRYTATNPASQTKWGRYAYTTETELAALADAQAMGAMLMARNYQPVWMLSALPVAVADLSAADTDRLLSLDISDLIHLTGLPGIGAAPTEVWAWVEGWSESLAFGVHDYQLIVSDYCRTARPVIWDYPGATTWDTIPNGATRTWDEALCLGGPLGPGVGRWDDTPSPLRWDQVAATVTWDTWVQPTSTEGAA